METIAHTGSPFPVVEAILANRLVGIVRLSQHQHAADIAQAFCDGGLLVLEYSLSGASAFEAIKAARYKLEAASPAAYVGAGTVLSVADADVAIDAGAQFIVTPTLQIEVIYRCHERHIPILCGALTPSEIHAAHLAGADLIKLFPARQGGPAYVRDLLAPLPFLKLVPTGGVSPENAAEFLDAGAVALAAAGGLVTDEDVENGKWSAIAERAHRYTTIVDQWLITKRNHK